MSGAGTRAGPPPRSSVAEGSADVAEHELPLNGDRSAVLIVDDHKLFAEAIHSSLEAFGVSVLGVATTGREAVALATSKRPRVVLMDVGLPDESGLVVGRRLIEELPNIR